jgi:predicted alpha-1,2-mannosidase
MKIQGSKSRVIISLALGVLACTQETKQPTDYVDPFICTQGDHGQWLPAALVPFGMVELGPDTYPGSLIADGDIAHGGYDYADHQLRGFSHMHRGSSGGVGITDRAGILSFVPYIHAPSDTFFVNPVLEFEKSSEEAKAGYYKTNLIRDQIQVELTAAAHVGMHRYSYAEKNPLNVFISAGDRERAFSCKATSRYSLEGSVGNVYFVAKFNAPFSAAKVWNGETLNNGSDIQHTPHGGLVIRFDEIKNDALLLKVGFSLSCSEAAGKNLKAECPGWDFSAVHQQATALWNGILSGITVEGGNEEDKIIFYTALYHTCFLPMITSDVDGSYRGLDRNTHQATDYKFYNNYAFWDSFRTKYPLYSIWIPEVYGEIAKSLRDIYQQAGNWDPFPDHDHPPHGFCYVVRGKDHYQPCTTCRHEHMLMVMADAYFKGLFYFPLPSVYNNMKDEAMIQMPERYDTIGFIPARPDQTGEYSWDSWCMAQLAKELDKQDDYEYFMQRAGYWENTWDPSIRFFRARAADGTWLDFPDDPTVNREKYTYEGSKWQWRWNVIHDVPALIRKFGGKKAFTRELRYFFDHDLYTAGNQIDLHAPFLFNQAGASWLTQQWVRKILTEPIVQKYGTHDFFPEPIFDRVYKASPDGYLEEMDCDYGCMAAWYNMSAMGLYQVCPGKPVYQLTAPIFSKITIHPATPDHVNTFRIETKNLSKKNIYIQSATLNGKALNRSWIGHDEIAGGGKLVFEMGPEPKKDWGLE